MKIQMFFYLHTTASDIMAIIFFVGYFRKGILGKKMSAVSILKSFRLYSSGHFLALWAWEAFGILGSSQED